MGNRYGSVSGPNYRVFTVSGNTPFPEHLLQEDGCVPWTALDEAAITNSRLADAEPTVTRRVRLVAYTRYAPSVKLWNACDWHVERDLEGQVHKIMLQPDEVKEWMKRRGVDA